MKNKLLKKYNCYIMVGIPGSGKTTFANNLIKFGAEIISIDAYIEDFAKEAKLKYSEVWQDKIKLAYSHFWKDLKMANKKANINLIIDKTNLTKSGRAKIIKCINRNLYNIICIDFSNIPLNVCLSRINKREKETGKDIPLDVVNNMIKLYEPPNYSEGFDYILKLSTME